MSTKSESSSPIPMSLQGLLYKAMSKMSSYDVEMMKQQLEYMIQSARAYGGWSQDGKTLDVNDGIIGRFITMSQNQADATKEGILDSAIGGMVASGVDLLGFVGSAYAGGFSEGDADLKMQSEDAAAFKTAINDPIEDPEIELRSTDTETMAEKKTLIESKRGEIESVKENRDNAVEEVKERIAKNNEEVSNFQQKIQDSEEKLSQLRKEEESLNAPGSDYAKEEAEKREAIATAATPENREAAEEDLREILERKAQSRETLCDKIQEIASEKEGYESSIQRLDRDTEELKTKMQDIETQAGVQVQSLEEVIQAKQTEVVELEKAERVEECLGKWKAGEFRGFKKDEEFHKTALRHLKKDPDFKAVQEQVNKYAETLGEKYLENRASKQNSRTMMASSLSGFGSRGAEAAGRIPQATEEAKAGKDKALAEVEETIMHQWDAQLADTKQKADAFLQDANAIASGYAQIVQTRG